jgi:hypothetical protein
MGGATIVPHSLKTKGNKKNLFLKSYMALLYLPIIDFPKIDPLTATGMGLHVNLGSTC